MNAEQRRRKLQEAAEQLMEKLTPWLENLDIQAESPQTIRQLCGTLKDLKELCRDLEQGQEQSLRVIIEGGEETWMN